MTITDEDRAKAADLYGRTRAVGPAGPDAIDLIAEALSAEHRRGFNDGALAGMKLYKEHHADA